MPTFYKSKSIHGIEMAFRVVDNHKLINLGPFNCHMASSLRHDGVTTEPFLQKSC